MNKKRLTNDTVFNLNVKLLSEQVQKELQIKNLVLNSQKLSRNVIF